ncbi:glycosyltransferase [Actinoplanes utahensis]|uniref:glycosyltransferase n=1 Tax=Actinoplanes utahensis TaxID=1869 RepID=UPI00068CE384|nr:galactosyltransferase-related protein [Actinoplanes utahensis]GIF33511.1 hypothetical protein Aut01nite_64970 [Actinoplanes utahensis]
MTSVPSAGDALASAAVRYTVLANDPAVPLVCATYWDDGEPFFRKADAAVEQFTGLDEAATEARRGLIRDPYDGAAHDRLARAVAGLLESRPEAGRELRQVVEEADRNIKIDYTFGPAYERTPEPITVAHLTERAARVRGTGPRSAAPLVHVVIPFRDHGESRARNLMACLNALRDQSLPAGRYTVTVVENDDRPRWAQAIEPAADDYRFIRSSGPFNKSWTVNVGVLTAAPEAALICVLDADILPDRDFLRRYADLLTSSDAVGCRFFEMHCMDTASSATAIGLRLSGPGGAVPSDRLRSYVITHVPGACHWVTRATFLAMNGMDERYQGWGREDNDFVARVAEQGRLIQSDEPLLHMEHERPPMRTPDGGLFNMGIDHDWSDGARRFGDPDAPSVP